MKMKPIPARTLTLLPLLGGLVVISLALVSDCHGHLLPKSLIMFPPFFLPTTNGSRTTARRREGKAGSDHPPPSGDPWSALGRDGILKTHGSTSGDGGIRQR